MKLEFFSNLSDLDRNRDQWDSVASDYPFFRWSWMGNWMRFLGTDLELAVVVAVDDDGKWIGIAPWCIDGRTPFSRRLRFLGSGDTCSDYLDLICPNSQYDSFSAAVVDWLDSNIGNPDTLGRIDVVELEGITRSRSQTDHLCELLTASGFQQHSTDLEGGWQVELPSTWDELNARFSKKMRRKTKKAVQRLAAPDATVLSTRDEPLEQVWPLFQVLHQQRREMLGQPGCFADHDFERFLKQAVADLIEESRAEVICLLNDGTPFAAMLLLHDHDTTYMYQSGMDPQFMKQEPGYQIAACAIARSIENGAKNFDFLRGDEPYKARWNTTRIPITRNRFIPRHSIAKLKHGIWLAGRSVKHWMTPTTSN